MDRKSGLAINPNRIPMLIFFVYGIVRHFIIYWLKHLIESILEIHSRRNVT
jgi:hypothetical protein